MDSLQIAPMVQNYLCCRGFQGWHTQALHSWLRALCNWSRHAHFHASFSQAGMLKWCQMPHRHHKKTHALTCSASQTVMDELSLCEVSGWLLTVINWGWPSPEGQFGSLMAGTGKGWVKLPGDWTYSGVDPVYWISSKAHCEHVQSQVNSWFLSQELPSNHLDQHFYRHMGRSAGQGLPRWKWYHLPDGTPDQSKTSAIPGDTVTPFTGCSSFLNPKSFG